MKIERATDWQEVHTKLRTELDMIGYNPDLRKMLENIANMVTSLSKLEVDARRIKRYTYTEELVLKINHAIDHLEKLVLMAKLMK
jgi:hypothetical protein